MAATITHEFMCGVTEKIRDAMEACCEDVGMKPSQFARQAIVEKLVKEGYLMRPNFRKVDNPARQVAEPAE